MTDNKGGKFITDKLATIQADKQTDFKDLLKPMADMAEKNERTRLVKADGNWFKVDFDVVDQIGNRLIIAAERINDGRMPSTHNPTAIEYRVEFKQTRAAYLYGYYSPVHRVGRWPYLSWNIRAYANAPNTGQRVYISGFRAHDEIQKMLTIMNSHYAARHVVNEYILDNLSRFKAGLLTKKTPEEIEREWSHGMMESMGYPYVEAIDRGLPKGAWNGVEVHWYMNKHESMPI